MDQAEEEQPAPAPPNDAQVAPPEVLNPESPRYQPWVEKQIFNASKEKRPLEEFLAEFEARVAAQGHVAMGAWDPGRNERLLARFSAPASPHRRRRRRPAAKVGAERAPAAKPDRRQGPRAGPPSATKATEPGTGAEHRRRRRRRPRGGRSSGAPASGD